MAQTDLSQPSSLATMALPAVAAGRRAESLAAAAGSIGACGCLFKGGPTAGQHAPTQAGVSH
eukprot:2412285-Prorocentrum_lima.AAC.1